jgi:replication initiation and membrane attachment protein
VENKDIVRVSNNKIKLKGDVDFNLLFSGLEGIIDEKIFTKDLKELITNLSYIYNIDVLTMQNLIKSCLNEKGNVDKITLRKAVRDYYQFENNGKLPTIIYNTQPEYLKKPMGDMSKKSKMIYTFENTNPYDFLKSKYKNGKVVQRDLNLLEGLLLDLKLTPGVVNVLIDYVLRVNNQKLVKNYTETIASSWKRLGIETVEEAMNECIKKNKKVGVKKTLGYNNIKDKKVPEWFDQEISKEELSKEETEKLQDLLQDYKN